MGYFGVPNNKKITKKMFVCVTYLYCVTSICYQNIFKEKLF